MWGTCQCKRHHFSDMYGKLSECPLDAVTKVSFASKSCGSLCLRKLESCVEIVQTFQLGLQKQKCCGHGYYLLSEFFYFLL